MTEAPRESETELTQKDVDRSAELERSEVDATEEDNAPNREPVTEQVGPAHSHIDGRPEQSANERGERADPDETKNDSDPRH
jgi:hypothetical protein